MSTWLLTGLILGGILLAIALLFAIGRWLERRAPYGAFLRLRTRAKLRFLRLLITDPRVPRRVKAIPFLLAAYLALPFDLIPDFIPVLGYLDDVAIALAALALLVRLLPRPLLDDLLRLAAQNDTD